jgi:hypothetical protein
MEDITSELDGCVLFDQADTGSPKRRSHFRFGNLDIEVSEAPHARARNARKQQPPPSVISAAREVSSDAHTDECFASACASQMCWHCMYTLEGIDPKRMPTGYMPMIASYTFEGFFCSWECMRAHSVAVRDLEGIARRAEYISKLQRDLHRSEWHIALAQRRELVSCLGGPLDHTEFRALFDHARNALPFSTRLLRREVPMARGVWYRVE